MNFDLPSENSPQVAWPLPKWIPHQPKTDCEGPVVRIERAMKREGGRCIYCNLDLVSNTELLLSAGLDHLVPKEVFRSAKEAGYTKTGDYRANLVFCCRPCNDAKGNWPLSLPSSQRINFLTQVTREVYLDEARKYTVARRRSEEKKVAGLMAKAWAQRATKFAQNGKKQMGATSDPA